LNYIFLLKTGGPVIAFLADLRVKDHLDDPANIAEVDKTQTPVIAESVHPAHEYNTLSRVRWGQVSTVDSLSPFHQ